MYHLQKHNGYNKNSKVYIEPHVCYDKVTKTVEYNEVEDLTKTPLTFEILTDGTITWQRKNVDVLAGVGINKTIRYSKNGGEFTEITASKANTITINVQAGDILVFKGDGNTSGFGAINWATGFEGTAQFNVKGNIMSIIDSSNFETNKELVSTSSYHFYYFFYNSNIVNAKDLLLPATNLSQNCYERMFGGCASLLTAPQLPALEMKNGCYEFMFASCSSLSEPPALPATKLATYCYWGMFLSCSNLNNAPFLPAPRLVDHCYDSMFKNCAKIKYIKCFFTDWNGAYKPTDAWLDGTYGSGTFVKHKDNNLTVYPDYVPANWTKEKEDYDSWNGNLRSSYINTNLALSGDKIYCKFRGKQENVILGAHDSTSTGITHYKYVISINSDGGLQVNNTIDGSSSEYRSFVSTALTDGINEIEFNLSTIDPAQYKVNGNTNHFTFNSSQFCTRFPSCSLFVHAMNNYGLQKVEGMSENNFELLELKITSSSGTVRYHIKPVEIYGMRAFINLVDDTLVFPTFLNTD